MPARPPAAHTPQRCTAQHLHHRIPRARNNFRRLNSVNESRETCDGRSCDVTTRHPPPSRTLVQFAAFLSFLLPTENPLTCSPATRCSLATAQKASLALLGRGRHVNARGAIRLGGGVGGGCLIKFLHRRPSSSRFVPLCLCRPSASGATTRHSPKPPLRTWYSPTRP